MWLLLLPRCEVTLTFTKLFPGPLAPKNAQNDPTLTSSRAGSDAFAHHHHPQRCSRMKRLIFGSPHHFTSWMKNTIQMLMNIKPRLNATDRWNCWLRLPPEGSWNHGRVADLWEENSASILWPASDFCIFCHVHRWWKQHIQHTQHPAILVCDWCKYPWIYIYI